MDRPYIVAPVGNHSCGDSYYFCCMGVLKVNVRRGVISCMGDANTSGSRYGISP